MNVVLPVLLTTVLHDVSMVKWVEYWTRLKSAFLTLGTLGLGVRGKGLGIRG
jgi:hypothetical protein